MRNTGLSIVALLVMQTLWAGISHAQSTGTQKFKEEAAKQESIYRGGSAQVEAGYTVDRGLVVYTDGLATGFDTDLAYLGPEDRWLDIGAGRGQAILDYYSSTYDQAYPEGQERRGRKAQAVAMSIEDRRTPHWHQSAVKLGPNQIQYWINKRLGEYSLEELGQFQVITDVIGGFSYTGALSQFMEKVLGALKVGGSFYSALQDVSLASGTNVPFYSGSPFLTEMARANGAEMKVCAWLKSISCVEVTCETRGHWKPPLETYRVLKVCNGVTIPALDLVHYQAGTPPERRFTLKK